MKWKVVFSLIILVILLFFLLPAHVRRYFIWNYADLGDGEKFPSVPVQKSELVQPLPLQTGIIHPKVPEKWNDESQKFDLFLEQNRTVAFLILKNDTLLYEKYFGGYGEQSLIPSFSVAKVFVSALCGIAIDEGYIYSPDQQIRFFIPELDTSLDRVTIRHLLNMQSGIQFSEAYNTPFSDMAKYYYGKHLKRYIRDLRLKQPPGVRYEYQSVNTLLLGILLERATGMPLNRYLEIKLWKPAGMESDANWNVDNLKDKTIKAFCCLNATARDFARFGNLYLHKGRLAGNQIIPASWVWESLRITPGRNDDSGYPYTFQWRILPSGAFFAKGILGQYIVVIPQKKLVMVRLGSGTADIDWAEFCIKLAEQF
ncbi:MAG: serine hydrolase [Bacteroidales bacterium]